MPRTASQKPRQDTIAPRVVGSIGPAVEMGEVSTFDGPTRTVELTDGAGRLRGRIQWLAEDVGEHSKAAILQFYVEMTEPSRVPSAVSSQPA